MDLSIKLGLVLAILLAIGYGIYKIRRWGQQAERGKVQEKTLEAIDETKRAADAVRSDPDYADRVRSKYERVLPDR